jgi:beta-glucosidase
MGYGNGIHAPGICDYTQAYRAAHHLLLSHGKAVQVFRDGGYAGRIGIVVDLAHFEPASDDDAGVAACERATEQKRDLFLGPVFEGRYPEPLFEWIGSQQPQVRTGDLEVINQPIDFLGVNYYHTLKVSHAIGAGPLKAAIEHTSAPGWGRTEMGWGVNPSGLKAVLLDLEERYRNPRMYVTENGCALVDTPDSSGFVADWGRVNYLREHLRAVYEAIEAGADVCGYFAWSLLDNFEWSHGYDPRFGIVRVDYETLERIPKQSARWYRDVISQNGINM